MRYIRANAHEWKINPDRIGVLGFSSGGHVAASLGTRFAEPVYTPIDSIDEQPTRPAFMALVYPVITLREDIGHPGSRLELVGATPEKEDLRHYSLEERVDNTTPPTFLLHAIDDPAVKVENSPVSLIRYVGWAFRSKCICLNAVSTDLVFAMRKGYRWPSGRK